MSRALNASELFRKLRSINMYDQLSGGGATTTSAAITQGASSVNVAGITGFTTGDPVFIEGDGGLERSAITGVVSAAPLLFDRPLMIAQSTGATVTEAVKKPLGRIEQAGISMNFSRALEDVLAADADNAVAFIEGAGTMEASFGLLSLSPENWQLINSLADDEVGSGTAADPHAILIGGNNQAVSPRRVFVMSALLQGGKLIEVDMLDARMSVSGGPTFGRSAASLPVSYRFTQAIVRTWAV